MNLETISYSEFKDISNEKYNNVPIHFFFSREQKEEVYEKLKVTDENAKENLFSAQGGVILKSEAHKLKEYWEWYNETIDILHKREDFLYQMFYYEFGNHESHISNSYEDVFNDFSTDTESIIVREAYEKAKKNHWEYVIKHDLF